MSSIGENHGSIIVKLKRNKIDRRNLVGETHCFSLCNRNEKSLALAFCVLWILLHLLSFLLFVIVVIDDDRFSHIQSYKTSKKSGKTLFVDCLSLLSIEAAATTSLLLLLLLFIVVVCAAAGVV